jgi:hypothetical protein
LRSLENSETTPSVPNQLHRNELPQRIVQFLAEVVYSNETKPTRISEQTASWLTDYVSS